jgi:DNA-binding CsgD family transcriptional regulator
MLREPIPVMSRIRLILCLESDLAAARSNAEVATQLNYIDEPPKDGVIRRATVLADRRGLVPREVGLSHVRGSELLQELAKADAPYATLSLTVRTGQRESENALAVRRFGPSDCLTGWAEFEVESVVFEEGTLCGSRETEWQPQFHLTRRETEVLTWVGRGKTSAEIAIILGLSARTVNFHCAQAMSRLDVTNRTQAVAKALAEGLITT